MYWSVLLCSQFFLSYLQADKLIPVFEAMWNSQFNWAWTQEIDAHEIKVYLKTYNMLNYTLEKMVTDNQYVSGHIFMSIRIGIFWNQVYVADTQLKMSQDSDNNSREDVVFTIDNVNYVNDHGFHEGNDDDNDDE